MSAAFDGPEFDAEIVGAAGLVAEAGGFVAGDGGVGVDGGEFVVGVEVAGGAFGPAQDGRFGSGGGRAIRVGVIGQSAALVEHVGVLGAVDLEDGERGRDAAVVGVGEGGAGEADDAAQAGHVLAGEAVGHEAAVGVSDGEDLIEGGDLAGFFDQRFEVGDIVDFGAEDVAAFGRPVPELVVDLVYSAVGQQQAELAGVDPLRELEVGVGFRRPAGVAVEQDDQRSGLGAVGGFG